MAVRIGLVLLVPLLGLLGLAGVGAYGFAGEGRTARDLRDAIAAGIAADRAAGELSKERRAAAELLLAGTDAAQSAQSAQAALDAQAAATDPAVLALRAAAGPAGLLTPGLSAGLDDLRALRAGVAAGMQEVAAGEYLMRYTQIVSDLVRLRQAVAGRPGPASVMPAARASGWLAVAREELAQIQLLDLRGTDTPARREALAAHRAAHLDALSRFAEATTPALRERLARVPSGVGGDAQPALDALAGLAADAGAGELARADAARVRLDRILLGGLGIVLALAIASVVLAALVARAPRARRRPAAADESRVAAPPVGEPALIDLARRSQRLAETLVQHLDAAERDEADPERLAQLFAFDHLATRIRHDNQSLLVLAGADSTPGRREPVSLVDLLRAAQSRIEDYRRIEYSMISPDLLVVPEAVDDVVHLLAELFDNATRNGPPDRPVLVEGRREAQGAVIEIADRGPGLPPERLAELNASLHAGDGRIDDRRTGLAVVARLAARHGVGLALQRPPTGTGLRVLVRLPPALVLRLPPPPPGTPVRRPVPKLLERGQPLPGGEPVDVPHPRSTLARTVPGPVPTPDGPTVVVEPEAVRAFLNSYQQAPADPVAAATNLEGRPPA
ncbi:nitrate- and nitrite sensing domain-containing protein [Dactylosporangium sp. NPDC051485]|uniref:sensor histidine kinase n=1 Tax=Dactylosporangium sp. NPDC051485 TaxID=3154846 RepID=UPI003424BFB8